MDQSLLWPLLGGLLIGGSALWLLGVSGRVAGVSGIVGGLIAPDTAAGDRGWRLGFLAGLGLGGLALLGCWPRALPDALPAPTPVVALAGLLVGFGASAAGGCTSGHGVCGLGFRSRRSLVAVLVFMGTGMLAAQLLRPALGVTS